MLDKVQLIKEEIEKKRQRIWPTNTGEMQVVDTPKQLVQGWLNCLKWIEDFIDSLPGEPASEDLEEYYQKEFLPKEWFAKTGERTISEFNFFTAKHFAEWQKEKIMKDAIECVVEDWCGDSPEVTIPLNPQDFKTGDKVKIIIVKED